MISAAAVLVCALEMLGRSPARVPPIQLVDVRPLEVSRQAEAYVFPGSGVISLLTTSEVFRLAQQTECQLVTAIRKLASIIVHEEWHVLHGPDERGAYEAQLSALIRFGASADSGVYYGVVRSMNAALAARARAERVLAANLTARRAP